MNKMKMVLKKKASEKPKLILIKKKSQPKRDPNDRGYFRKKTRNYA